MNLKKILLGFISMLLVLSGTGVTAFAQDGYDAEFHNTTVSAVDVDFPDIYKNLNGDAYTGTDFSFQIAETGGATETATSVTAGKVDYTHAAIHFDEAGEKEFTITEIAGNDARYQYDNSVYKVLIGATLETDQETGVKSLVPYVNITRNDVVAQTITFGNQGITPIDIQFPTAYADLDGEPYSGNKLSFTITETGGATESVSVVSNGVIPFDMGSLNFTDPGERVFTITEDGSTDPSIKTDETVFILKIGATIHTDEQTGAKSLVPYTEIKANGIDVNEVRFTNSTYNAQDYTLAIQKLLDGEPYTNEGTAKPFQIRISVQQADSGIKFVDADSNVREISERIGTTRAYSDIAAGQVDFEYDTLTFQNPGSVQFRIWEFNRSDGQYQYDGTVYSVVLEARPIGDTKNLEINCSITNQAGTQEYDDITFRNTTAVAEPVDVTFTAEKANLTNYDGDGFDFYLEQYFADAVDPEPSYVLIDEINGLLPGYSENFQTITYTQAGTFEYLMTEKDNSAQEQRIIFDGSLNYFKVDVEQQTSPDGPVLVAKVYKGIYRNGEIIYPTTPISGNPKVTFTNSYVAPITYNFSNTVDAEINLDDEKYSGSLFNFTISDASRTINSANPVSNGVITFTNDAVTYNTVGTHNYILKQTTGANKMTYYDPTAYIITVDVVREGNLLVANTTLHPALTNSTEPDTSVQALEKAVFNNYTFDPTEITVMANKLFQDAAYTGDAFTFELLNSEKEVIKTATSTGGKVTFAPESADKYVNTFYVREVKGEDAAVNYDSRLYKAIVSFKDPENPSIDNKEIIVDKIEYYVSTGEDQWTKLEDGKLPQFNNTVIPVNVTVSATKVYNAQAYTGNDYTFYVKDTTEDKKILITVKEVKSGIVDFGSISFTKPGKYEFTINELIPVDSSALTQTIYDDRVYTLTVIVSREGIEDYTKALEPGKSAEKQGKLVATATYTLKGEKVDVPKFENDPRPISTSYQFTARKTLDSKVYSGNAFTYELYDNDGKKIQSNNIAQNGVINFGSIRYDKVGRYTYKVKEVKGSDSKYRYDESEYTIVVEVSLDRTTNKLSATAKISKGNTPAKAVEFANFSSSVSPTPTPTPSGGNGGSNSPAMGDSPLGAAAVSIFGIALIALAVAAFARKKESK